MGDINYGQLVKLRKDGTDLSAYSLFPGDHTIGSSTSQASIRLYATNSNVKDVHCIIAVNEDDGIATLINKAPLDPVQLNGKLIVNKICLKQGDVISLFGNYFRYVNEEIVEMQKPLKSRPKTPIKARYSEAPALLKRVVKRAPATPKNDSTLQSISENVTTRRTNLRHSNLMIQISDDDIENESTRDVITPITEELEDSCNTPANNTSVVVIDSPLEESISMRSRKSLAKNISIKRLTQNDDSVIVLDSPNSKTPKSIRKSISITPAKRRNSLTPHKSLRKSVSKRRNTSRASGFFNATPGKDSEVSDTIETGNVSTSCNSNKQETNGNNSTFDVNEGHESVSLNLIEKNESNGLAKISPIMSRQSKNLTKTDSTRKSQKSEANVTNNRTIEDIHQLGNDSEFNEENEQVEAPSNMNEESINLHELSNVSAIHNHSLKGRRLTRKSNAAIMNSAADKDEIKCNKSASVENIKNEKPITPNIIRRSMKSSSTPFISNTKFHNKSLDIADINKKFDSISPIRTSKSFQLITATDNMQTLPPQKTRHSLRSTALLNFSKQKSPDYSSTIDFNEEESSVSLSLEDRSVDVVFLNSSVQNTGNRTEPTIQSEQNSISNMSSNNCTDAIKQSARNIDSPLPETEVEEKSLNVSKSSTKKSIRKDSSIVNTDHKEDLDNEVEEMAKSSPIKDQKSMNGSRYLRSMKFSSTPLKPRVFASANECKENNLQDFSVSDEEADQVSPIKSRKSLNVLKTPRNEMKNEPTSCKSAINFKKSIVNISQESTESSELTNLFKTRRSSRKTAIQPQSFVEDASDHTEIREKIDVTKSMRNSSSPILVDESALNIEYKQDYDKEICMSDKEAEKTASPIKSRKSINISKNKSTFLADASENAELSSSVNARRSSRKLNETPAFPDESQQSLQDTPNYEEPSRIEDQKGSASDKEIKYQFSPIQTRRSMIVSKTPINDIKNAPTPLKSAKKKSIANISTVDASSECLELMDSIKTRNSLRKSTNKGFAGKPEESFQDTSDHEELKEKPSTSIVETRTSLFTTQCPNKNTSVVENVDDEGTIVLQLARSIRTSSTPLKATENLSLAESIDNSDQEESTDKEIEDELSPIKTRRSINVSKTPINDKKNEPTTLKSAKKLKKSIGNISTVDASSECLELLDSIKTRSSLRKLTTNQVFAGKPEESFQNTSNYEELKEKPNTSTVETRNSLFTTQCPNKNTSVAENVDDEAMIVLQLASSIRTSSTPLKATENLSLAESIDNSDQEESTDKEIEDELSPIKTRRSINVSKTPINDKKNAPTPLKSAKKLKRSLANVSTADTSESSKLIDSIKARRSLRKSTIKQVLAAKPEKSFQDTSYYGELEKKPSTSFVETRKSLSTSQYSNKNASLAENVDDEEMIVLQLARSIRTSSTPLKATVNQSLVESIDNSNQEVTTDKEIEDALSPIKTRRSMNVSKSPIDDKNNAPTPLKSANKLKKSIANVSMADACESLELMDSIKARRSSRKSTAKQVFADESKESLHNKSASHKSEQKLGTSTANLSKADNSESIDLINLFNSSRSLRKSARLQISTDDSKENLQEDASEFDEQRCISSGKTRNSIGLSKSLSVSQYSNQNSSITSRPSRLMSTSLKPSMIVLNHEMKENTDSEEMSASEKEEAEDQLSLIETERSINVRKTPLSNNKNKSSNETILENSPNEAETFMSTNKKSYQNNSTEVKTLSPVKTRRSLKETRSSLTRSSFNEFTSSAIVKSIKKKRHTLGVLDQLNKSTRKSLGGAITPLKELKNLLEIKSARKSVPSISKQILDEDSNTTPIKNKSFQVKYEDITPVQMSPLAEQSLVDENVQNVTPLTKQGSQDENSFKTPEVNSSLLTKSAIKQRRSTIKRSESKLFSGLTPMSAAKTRRSLEVYNAEMNTISSSKGDKPITRKRTREEYEDNTSIIVSAKRNKYDASFNSSTDELNSPFKSENFLSCTQKQLSVLQENEDKLCNDSPLGSNIMKKALTEPRNKRKRTNRNSLPSNTELFKQANCLDDDNSTVGSVDTSSFIYMSGNASALKTKSAPNNKVQKSPRNDLTDFEGVPELFESPIKMDLNVSGVSVLHDGDDEFTLISGKQPVRTYDRKTMSPYHKKSVSRGRRTETVLLGVEPDVENWLKSAKKAPSLQTTNSDENEDLHTPVKTPASPSIQATASIKLKKSKKQEESSVASSPKSNSGSLQGNVSNVNKNEDDNIEETSDKIIQKTRHRNVQRTTQEIITPNLEQVKRTRGNNRSKSPEKLLQTKETRLIKESSEDEILDIPEQIPVIGELENVQINFVESSCDDVSLRNKANTQTNCKKIEEPKEMTPNILPSKTRSRSKKEVLEETPVSIDLKNLQIDLIENSNTKEKFSNTHTQKSLSSKKTKSSKKDVEAIEEPKIESPVILPSRTRTRAKKEPNTGTPVAGDFKILQTDHVDNTTSNEKASTPSLGKLVTNKKTDIAKKDEQEEIKEPKKETQSVLPSRMRTRTRGKKEANNETSLQEKLVTPKKIVSVKKDVEEEIEEPKGEKPTILPSRTRTRAKKEANHETPLQEKLVTPKKIVSVKKDVEEEIEEPKGEKPTILPSRTRTRAKKEANHETPLQEKLVTPKKIVSVKKDVEEEIEEPKGEIPTILSSRTRTKAKKEANNETPLQEKLVRPKKIVSVKKDVEEEIEEPKGEIPPILPSRTRTRAKKEANNETPIQEKLVRPKKIGSVKKDAEEEIDEPKEEIPTILPSRTRTRAKKEANNETPLQEKLLTSKKIVSSKKDIEKEIEEPQVETPIILSSRTRTRAKKEPNEKTPVVVDLKKSKRNNAKVLEEDTEEKKETPVILPSRTRTRTKKETQEEPSIATRSAKSEAEDKKIEEHKEEKPMVVVSSKRTRGAKKEIEKEINNDKELLLQEEKTLDSEITKKNTRGKKITSDKNEKNKVDGRRKKATTKEVEDESETDEKTDKELQEEPLGKNNTRGNKMASNKNKTKVDGRKRKVTTKEVDVESEMDEPIVILPLKRLRRGGVSVDLDEEIEVEEVPRKKGRPRADAKVESNKKVSPNKTTTKVVKFIDTATKTRKTGRKRILSADELEAAALNVNEPVRKSSRLRK